MLKAIIFDFDGIIADTEPTHLEAFKRVLQEIDISLTDKDYYENYLAFDDKKLFSEVLKINKREIQDKLVKTLIRKKSILINRLFSEYVGLFPGFLNYLDNIKNRYRLAIASGALRSEIVFVLNKFNIENEFRVITAADDVVNCKPNPEVFIKSLKSLNETNNETILPEECLVIEDSAYGIRAAKEANMNCLAITHTYNEENLHEADILVNNFSDLDMMKVEKIFN
ncbi:MAG: HAD family hydrolase [Thermodesulfobacteriota bacterium]